MNKSRTNALAPEDYPTQLQFAEFCRLAGRGIITCGRVLSALQLHVDPVDGPLTFKHIAAVAIACHEGRVSKQEFQNLLRPKENLLGFLGTVTIPVVPLSIVVGGDNFVINTGSSELVTINHFSSYFRACFLSSDAKIKSPVGEVILRYYKLTKWSCDSDIITELGGVNKAETTRYEVLFLLAQQKNGESGVLLTNGKANIFWVRDDNGVLRVVYVNWRGGGWNVDADSVEVSSSWADGLQVFSRKPSDTV